MITILDFFNFFLGSVVWSNIAFALANLRIFPDPATSKDTLL